MSRSPVPQVSASCSRSLRISLVGYSGSLRRLKLKGIMCKVNVMARTMQPHPPHTYHVLAAGSLLAVYSILDIVNLHSPVAPTRLQNPPSGTRELKNDDN